MPDLVEPLVERLRAAGCVFAEDEARLLTAEATGDRLEALVARRVAGEPLEHVLGFAEFCGLRVAVDPGVFVPRRRTELVVELALEVVRRRRRGPASSPGDLRGGPSVVVDLCCGCGAIAAAMTAALPDAEVWAADVDPAAVACARRNLLPERVVLGDLYEALPERLRGGVDVIAVNAPYVPSDAVATMPREARDHEPRIALDGGTDGVDVHRRTATGSREWLRSGGHLLVETSRSQARLTVAACLDADLPAYVETDDDRGATVVVATAP